MIYGINVYNFVNITNNIVFLWSNLFFVFTIIKLSCLNCTIAHFSLSLNGNYLVMFKKPTAFNTQLRAPKNVSIIALCAIYSVLLWVCHTFYHTLVTTNDSQKKKSCISAICWWCVHALVYCNLFTVVGVSWCFCHTKKCIMLDIMVK